MGHSIALDVAQPGTNSNANGYGIEIRTADGTAYRELAVGGGHASGQLGWTHFGLGDQTSAAVRVTCPTAM